ncbi:hypothetical protein ACJ73_10115 [Blastomyces percursus]|uniref:Chromo domain-containing protein n=1 Tax=Blastomyces percursus TaxID=1658174 RepID=A0A1J9Q0F0_9EURO|nr:hypothetical protein ACJ73_10115 [Blastomyces percursus]
MAQQEQEKQANKHRNPAPSSRSTLQEAGRTECKIYDTRTDREYNYKLDTPQGINDVFHADLLLLHLAATDTLPSQVRSDPHPPTIAVDNHEEYGVDNILKKRRFRNRDQYLVKWTGYARPTWEWDINVEETICGKFSPGGEGG